jgi:hypothetical protein
MTTVHVQRQADDGVWIFKGTGLIGAGSEAQQAIFVPIFELPDLAAALCRIVGGNAPPLVGLREAMEPLLHLAYHTLDQASGTELYKDAHARLTIGDIRRLAWRIYALKQHAPI